ncbi:MAG: hypothetical protein BWZ10_01397 [candidate division BRC1 bacterium ADurb.BinA364]|nr:MAG: hypothetical protein BWZ10_01397 [candidate division BRC1 bacterium ADurb.BinA364]
MQSGDFRIGAAAGHHQDIAGGVVPGLNEHPDEVDDDQRPENRENDEQNLVDKRRPVDVSRFVIIVGDALERRQVNQASRPHPRPDQRNHAGKHRGVRIAQPAMRLGGRGETTGRQPSQRRCQRFARRKQNRPRQAGADQKQYRPDRGERQGRPAHLVVAHSASEEQGDGKQQRAESQEGDRRNAKRQGVQRAIFRRLVELLPHHHRDQPGDDGGQIVNRAEEQFAPRNLLQQYGQNDRRQEGQGHHQRAVAQGVPYRLPPIAVVEHVGEVVEPDPSRIAQNRIILKRHDGSAQKRHVLPEKNGQRGGQQNDVGPGIFAKGPGRRLPSRLGGRQKRPRDVAKHPDKGRHNGRQRDGGREAPLRHFARRDNADHFLIGPGAGFFQQAMHDIQPGLGIFGQLVVERQLFGFLHRKGHQVIGHIAVAAIRFGHAAGDGDFEYVAPSLGRQPLDFGIAEQPQIFGIDELAHAPVDHHAGFDFQRLGRIVEFQILPGRVAHGRLFDPRKKAEHATVQFAAALAGGAQRHGNHAGDFRIDRREHLFVDIGEHHRDFAALPLDGRIGGVLRRVPPADFAFGVRPFLGAQPCIIVQGDRGLAAVEHAAPLVRRFVVFHHIAAGRPEKRDPVPGLVLSALQQQPGYAPLGIRQPPRGGDHVVPGPIRRRIRDSFFVKQILAKQQHLAQSPAIGHGPDAHPAIRPFAADHRPKLRMDAEVDLLPRHAAQVAVLGIVQRIEKAILDVIVGFAKIDVEHVGSDVAGDGQQVDFNSLHLDPRKAAQFDFHAIPVIGAVSLRIRLVFVAIFSGEYFGKALGERANRFRIGAHAGLRVCRIGQAVDRHMNHGLVRQRLDPSGPGRMARQADPRGEQAESGQDWSDPSDSPNRKSKSNAHLRPLRG